MGNSLRWTTVLALAASVSLAAQQQAPSWPRGTEPANVLEPKAAPASALALIGTYETKAAPGETPKHAIVFEEDGTTWITIDRAPARRFPQVYDTFKDQLFTERVPGTSRERVISLSTGNDTFWRVQVGPADGGQLRVTPVGSVTDILKAAWQTSPPKETGDFRAADLVDVRKLTGADTIQLDVRYATTNNFLSTQFYTQARAYLQRPAAEAVVRVHKQLEAFGYGIRIHDGYRPWAVTKAFWDATPVEKHWLVANPASGSKHNRGCAVDLTIYDLSTGFVVEMPSTYDESTERAYAFYPGGTAQQRWHRALLRKLMEAEGFTVNPEEWWHFDYKDWKSYAIGNVPFENVK